MSVGEAVGIIRAGSDVNFGCAAHQMIVVDAFGALACPYAGQDLGQATVCAGVDEGGAGGMVLGAADIKKTQLYDLMSVERGCHRRNIAVSS